MAQCHVISIGYLDSQKSSLLMVPEVRQLAIELVLGSLVAQLAPRVAQMAARNHPTMNSEAYSDPAVVDSLNLMQLAFHPRTS